jgi:hypothetical protein
VIVNLLVIGRVLLLVPPSSHTSAAAVHGVAD